MDDLDAITQLMQGDIDGLSELVKRYQVKAIRTAYLITQDAALAQDVAQDTFLGLYRTIRQFDTSRPFLPWFMRILVNNAIKAAQRTPHHHSLENAEQDFPEQFADPAMNLEETIESLETEAAIWAALSTLTPERRAVIVLRFYLEFSEAEMSEYLAVPTGTIKSRLHAAKRQLRDLLHPNVRAKEGTIYGN
jgi:RNA polymerase sigma-70 factor (ECF subfamily)